MDILNMFFDTEFTGFHQDTTLISIGIVLSGRILDSGFSKTFYAEFTDYDKLQVDEWIQNNVIDNLRFSDHMPNTMTRINGNIGAFGDTKYITERLLDWLPKEPIEVWSDCLHYDWMLFCQLFGGAMLIPKNINYIPFDICTLFKIKGIDPDISREKFVEIPEIQNKKHNALYDAIVIKKCYDKLMRM